MSAKSAKAGCTHDGGMGILDQKLSPAPLPESAFQRGRLLVLLIEPLLRSRKQCIQRNGLQEIAGVFVALQAIGSNERVVDGCALRKLFPQEIASSDQCEVIILIDGKLIVRELDLAHVDHVVLSLNHQVNLCAG